VVVEARISEVVEDDGVGAGLALALLEEKTRASTRP
jgi:hypothetical protein